MKDAIPATTPHTVSSPRLVVYLKRPRARCECRKCPSSKEAHHVRAQSSDHLFVSRGCRGGIGTRTFWEQLADGSERYLNQYDAQ